MQVFIQQASHELPHNLEVACLDRLFGGSFDSQCFQMIEKGVKFLVGLLFLDVKLKACIIWGISNSEPPREKVKYLLARVPFTLWLLHDPSLGMLVKKGDERQHLGSFGSRAVLLIHTH